MQLFRGTGPERRRGGVVDGAADPAGAGGAAAENGGFMNCPVCKLPLLTVEFQGVEVDYCARGHGQWFDEGEIEAAFDAPGSMVRADLQAPKGRRRCPRCHAPMRIQFPAEGLELDVCPHGHGLWFDAGELHSLLEKLQRLSGRTPDGMKALLERIPALFRRENPWASG
ncbi:MAG: hypothetical protein GMKNLPBB_03341 [Myxococcota bacterium]|nr:hypothetical protein [Myxococcota bacterium]